MYLTWIKISSLWWSKKIVEFIDILKRKRCWGILKFSLTNVETYASEMQSPPAYAKHSLSRTCILRSRSWNIFLTTTFLQRLYRNVFLTTSFLQRLYHRLFLTNYFSQRHSQMVFLIVALTYSSAQHSPHNVTIYNVRVIFLCYTHFPSILNSSKFRSP